MVALEFDDPVKSRQDDSFVCRGVRPDAHFRASARSPLQSKARKKSRVGAVREPPHRCAATIHPDRYFSKGFSSSNIGGGYP